MLDSEHQHLVNGVIENTMLDIYQMLVVIGVSIISILLGAIVFFIVKYFNRIDSFPHNYLDLQRYERDRIELRAYHDADVSAIRREMLSCQQEFAKDVDRSLKQLEKSDKTMTAIHRRIDELYKEPPAWYHPVKD